tara:strand:+ start:49325 stop:49651 length:327 start_codon:yes stop_codon:yes gene_type:complete
MISPLSLFNKLGRLTALEHGISVQAAQTFLLVAMNEGASLKELADKMDLPQSSVGRYLQDLSDSGRSLGGRRKASMGLVRVDVNPSLMRQKMFSLTPKGKRLLADLLA